MRYLLMIYGEEAGAPMTPEAWTAMMAEYGTYTEWLRGSGMYLGGEALKDSTDATSVRVRDGRRLVTDGPFAETKEVLGGYFLVNAPDLDAAIDAAARIPGARFGTVEVRPIAETDL